MKLRDQDEGVAIIRDSGETINLTEQEARALGLNIRQIPNPAGDDGLARERFRGLRTLPVDDATLSLDAHHTRLILRIEHGQLETAFEIAPDKIEALRDALTRKLEQIAVSEMQTRQ